VTYYSCLSCPDHNTTDHDNLGLGACLFPDCSCQKMEPGAEFFKRSSPRMSREEHLKATEERGEKEAE
jgi:hypothetical protein